MARILNDILFVIIFLNFFSFIYFIYLFYLFIVFIILLINYLFQWTVVIEYTLTTDNS